MQSCAFPSLVKCLNSTVHKICPTVDTLKKGKTCLVIGRQADNIHTVIICLVTLSSVTGSWAHMNLCILPKVTVVQKVSVPGWEGLMFRRRKGTLFGRRLRLLYKFSK
jgi:hypothetical protein